MAQKVSEMALAECRGAMEVGSPLEIDPRAVYSLQEDLRSSFEEVLDKNGGAQHWERDRPKMLFQSSAVGTLASTFCVILQPGAKVVSHKHLRLAFEFVKAGCDVARLDFMTIYCTSYPTPPAFNKDFWEAARR